MCDEARAATRSSIDHEAHRRVRKFELTREYSFDENALLSFDRERGGRARLGFNIGQPRIIGLTVRRRFGGR